MSRVDPVACKQRTDPPARGQSVTEAHVREPRKKPAVTAEDFKVPRNRDAYPVGRQHRHSQPTSAPKASDRRTGRHRSTGAGAWPRAGGPCRRLAQKAIRLAEALGLLAVHERRLSYDRSDTNVITIISQEWRVWLRLADKGTGCKTIPPTPHKFRKMLGEEAKRVPEHRQRSVPPERDIFDA
jgi:hypothetical protein